MSNMAPAVATDFWIVVNTQPHKESLAIEHLKRQGFEVYCPMITRRIRHARRAYDALRPLFPSYVFVRFASAVNSWRVMLSTYGVRTVVRSGEGPGCLSGDFIGRLKAREVDGAVRRPDDELAPGQNVAVCGGPMDGLVAKILEMRSNERILVLLDMLNQPVKATLKSDQVRIVR